MPLAQAREEKAFAEKHMPLVRKAAKRYLHRLVTKGLLRDLSEEELVLMMQNALIRCFRKYWAEQGEEAVLKTFRAAAALNVYRDIVRKHIRLVEEEASLQRGHFENPELLVKRKPGPPPWEPKDPERLKRLLLDFDEGGKPVHSLRKLAKIYGVAPGTILAFRRRVFGEIDLNVIREEIMWRKRSRGRASVQGSNR